MTLTPVNSLNMKLKPNSTQPPIFDGGYEHPWYAYEAKLRKPNPPTPDSVERAKFIDKTFRWNGR